MGKSKRPAVYVPYHWDCLFGWSYFPFASQLPVLSILFSILSGFNLAPNA